MKGRGGLLEVSSRLYFILYCLGSWILNTSALDVAVVTTVTIRGVGDEGLGRPVRKLL